MDTDEHGFFWRQKGVTTAWVSGSMASGCFVMSIIVNVEEILDVVESGVMAKCLPPHFMSQRRVAGEFGKREAGATILRLISPYGYGWQEY